MSTEHDRRFYDEHGNYIDGPHWGKDCPVGKVQVEFLSVSPSLQFSPHSWKPTDHVFLDVYVDGRRYNIQIGTYESASGNRRGLHIVTDVAMKVDVHSINALDVYFDAPPKEALELARPVAAVDREAEASTDRPRAEDSSEVLSSLHIAAPDEPTR